MEHEHVSFKSQLSFQLRVTHDFKTQSVHSVQMVYKSQITLQINERAFVIYTNRDIWSFVL